MPKSKLPYDGKEKGPLPVPITFKKKKKHKQATAPVYKKVRLHALLAGLLAALLVLLFSFYFLLVPLNVHAPSLWISIFAALLAFAALHYLTLTAGSAGYEQDLATGQRTWTQIHRKASRLFILPVIIILAFVIILIAGTTIFNASRYSSILTVEDAVFADDLEETLNSDAIALMDTSSARMLGDREIGSLSNVVSQYNVSEDYTQIDFNGTPKKVAPLDYAGFFKWIGNRSNGTPGYVMVDPVSMSASYQQSEAGMIYVPSAYFNEDAARHIRMHYPTVMFGNLHFEVDEDGNPYYVASVYKKTVLLFGGTTVDGAILLNPSTGELTRYALEDVPTWVDVAFDGDLLCEQYNWFGTLKNGFFNSIIGKKGCKQVTTYRTDDEDEDSEDTPVSDYGYVAKDGDIWIYTGVTSVNSDSSNIGFLLANERTGEAHYYTIAGADEKSAMAAAEGEVQEKGYQASFPALINVDSTPTYIMVLKDASGLVKLFAAVNVEQYNLVTTAASQQECIQKYRSMLGLAEDTTTDENSSSEPAGTEEPIIEATAEMNMTIADIKYIDIDGNTYIYLIDEDDTLLRAKAASHEDMLLLTPGDRVHLTYAGTEIVTCTRLSSE